jgi:hypothetical protein
VLSCLPDPDDLTRLGLGAAVLYVGAQPVRAWLIFHEGVGPAVRELLAAWGVANALDGPTGPVPWAVVDRPEFNRKALVRFGYRGRVPVVGAHLGRSLALLADYWWPARKRRGAWVFGLAGLGEVATWPDHRGNPRTGWRTFSRHWPTLSAKGIGRRGLQVSWQSCSRNPGTGRLNGQTNRDGSAYRGRFVELLTAPYALDGSPSDDLADHLPAFGLEAVADLGSARPDEAGAKGLAALVGASGELLRALAREAGLWGNDGLDLARLLSPGGMVGPLLAGAGLVPPLAKGGLDDAELAAWAACLHGGEVSYFFPPVPFMAADADVRSAHPAGYELLGGPDYHRADHFRTEDATAELAALLGLPRAELLAQLYDPATWRRFGLTRAELVPGGAVLPLQHDPKRLDTSPVSSPEPVHVAWPHLAASVLRSHGLRGRLVRAVRLVPEGRQEGLRPVRLRGDVTVPAGGDLVAAMTALRSEAKARGDKRLVALLRAVVNATAYGQAAHFSTYSERKPHRAAVLRERPGPWCFPPLAACVVAGTALLVAMFAAEAEDRGSRLAYIDTDGAVVPASPDGGVFSLPDGTTLRSLPWAELDAILSRFERLNPWADGRPLWDVARGERDDPLWAICWGPKKYALGRLRDDGFEPERPEHVGPDAPGLAVEGATEHGLGGTYVSPPGWGDLMPDGRRRWSAEVPSVHAARELARSQGREPALAFGWDPPGAQEFPALRRLPARTPRTLAQLPTDLGTRPFAYFLRGTGAFPGQPGAVALDPGQVADGDAWERFGWHDPASGAPVLVSTNHEPGTRPLKSLGAVAVEWARSPKAPTDGLRLPEPLLLDPALRRLTGQAGAHAIARSADPEADLSDVLPAGYNALDVGRAVSAAARRLGPKRFAATTGVPLRTAKRLSAGGKPHAATVATVLSAARSEGEAALAELLDLADDRLCQGCARPLSGRQRRWCSGCRANAWERARALRGAKRCPICGAVRFGDVSGPCPSCQGRRPDEVAGSTCPGCGSLRLGDPESPCPVCHPELYRRTP